MKTILKIVSLIGLLLTAVPSFLVLKDIINMKTNFNIMFVGMIIYFGTAPFWMKSKPLEETED